MLSVENLKDQLSEDQLKEMVSKTLDGFPDIKKVLFIHPDYSRVDFTNRLVPLIYQELKEKGMEQIDSLNAGGTHRKMTRAEIETKLGLKETMSFHHLYNHQFDQPEELIKVGEISSDFVSLQTKGELNQSIPVVVNKLILEDYDLIITLSGTSPHEAAGYSGGLKIFFPGISGPEVIDLLHWAAVLVGIPSIIGSIDNAARRVINKGSSYIFNAIKAPVVSFNMLFQEGEENQVVPNGLYSGVGFNGFIDAYQMAAEASSRIHVIYVENPVRQAVQVMDYCYDEIWTAGKGSYKLQSPGLMTPGGEIIIYAPHIHCFHSQSEMEKNIREIGYHGKSYVQHYLDKHPDFSRNVAAHVINVRGDGEYYPDSGEESYPFQVTLATGISREICQSVGLGYRDPESVRKQDFMGADQLWIEHGGKYLYQLRKNKSIR